MKKGQSAVETMMVITFATILLIPTSYMFYNFLSDTSSEIVEKNVDRIGKSFVDNVNLVYHYGNNARITIDYTFPEGIQNMSIVDEQLVFTYAGEGATKQMTYLLGQNTTGTFAENDWSEGPKHFEFKTISGGDAVSITKV